MGVSLAIAVAVSQPIGCRPSDVVDARDRSAALSSLDGPSKSARHPSYPRHVLAIAIGTACGEERGAFRRELDGVLGQCRDRSEAS